MRKAFLAVVLMVMAFAVRADYLYWLIDEADPLVKAQNFDTAILSYEYDGVAQQIVTLNGIESIIDNQYGGYIPHSADLLSHVGEGYSYFVELMNGGDFVAKSAVMAYADIQNSIWMGGIQPSVATPATFTSFAVPEPTGGILMLVGGVLLGLKRRRMA